MGGVCARRRRLPAADRALLLGHRPQSVSFGVRTYLHRWVAGRPAPSAHGGLRAGSRTQRPPAYSLSAEPHTTPPCLILRSGMQGKMGKIHGRLGRVEANPSIFNTGGAGAMARDGGGSKGTIFDVDFGGGM